MGRQARATPEELARACKKLQADDNLTIHTLRHELGGGGAEYLTRGLREWRQQQREEARVPIEQMVSAALRSALTEDLRRVRDEAIKDVHADYADDRQHLEFCLTELRRAESACNEMKKEKEAAGSLSENVRMQFSRAQHEIAERLAEQVQRADALSTRCADLLQANQKQMSELDAARKLQIHAEEELASLRQNFQECKTREKRLQTEQLRQTAELAMWQERCAQQQEMTRYMRADLQAKATEIERSVKTNEDLNRQLRTALETAATATASAQTSSKRAILDPIWQSKLNHRITKLTKAQGKHEHAPR